jgi:beta-carotene ketolase (CrtW type)
MRSPSRINLQNSVQGIIIATTIIGLWSVVALFALSSKISHLNSLQLIAIIGGQTFLYTGLFITGHEAMHGLVLPRNLKLNHLIGAIAVLLYAAFPYQKLLRRHWQHHHHPATSLDPDFHNGNNASFWAWYGQFLRRYWSWWQFCNLILVFSAMIYWLHVSLLNLLLFVLIPSLLSSLQLFYFGTFLPHRQPTEGYQYPHCAQSNAFPVVISFLTCYHFGYHLEHHQYPTTPWWQIPKLRPEELSK